jgi:hypothetical protein
MPELAWTQNAARPRDDIGEIALMQRVSHRNGATGLAQTSKPQPIAVEHKTRGTTMDTTSIVTSRPALADGGAGLQGAGTCRPGTASTCALSSISQIRSTRPRNPTKVVRL